MNYENYTTFKATKDRAILTITFDYPPVNVQGIPMLDDLNRLAETLEGDRSIKVVVFQSAHPEIFVAHADTNFLKDMSTTAVSRDDVEVLYLQTTLERISKLPQATIAKIEGFARGGGHEFALACDMRFAARGKAMGYLSASRSIEAVNFLRFQSCPYDTPNCVVNCSAIVDHTPCQVVDPLRDTTLWGHTLEPGQRGPLWRSNSRILNLYDDAQRVYFCYVNVGTEIARIEVPAWVVEYSALFEQSLSIMLGQVHKGYGYPIALSEAHNQAVVRGGDRVRFFALLEQQMIRAGLKNVGTSYKETRKRGSIA
ncbi:MAG: DNA double-strand break repair nuclease NurA [Moorea sp. SIO2B7]|nr:DNA double-strand break repair nuclease NurA [Moorena sp. SIO2B7]